MRSKVSWVGLVLLLAGCAGEPDDEGGATQHCEDAIGRWELGDDNLFMEVAADCTISNFCSIREGIHTRGTVTDSELRLDRVGTGPLTFFYTLSAGTLTIIDGASPGTDLPLRTMTEAMPALCPSPP